jgi:UDP-N-acetylmuramyl pentapeptide phosphotransferase/UDP-N-acetylglucosamine-1-phosphate transferase
MRGRYVIAGVAATAWLVACLLVIQEPSSLLDFVIPVVGGLIFGAIAWPDDFRRNPPTHRDEPPQA